MALLRDQREKDLIGRYSSFASVEKVLSQVVERLLMNERLKRLLYYTDKRALHLPKLTNEQSLTLINNHIKIVPKISIDHDAKSFVVLSVNHFEPDENQTTFRSFELGISILCPFEFWQLEDFKLRPYAIAGEIDAMINKSFITTTGVADFKEAVSLMSVGDLGGVMLIYNVETLKDDTKLHPPEK